MALTYGFYDSLDGDRKYNARQWSSIFDGVVNDGVLASIGTCFGCTATGSDMIITVGAGRAWFDHTWVLSDGDANNPITFSWATGTSFAPEPVSIRIDAIVIQTDSTPSVRANSITRVKGTPGSGKPSMTHTNYVNQYPIAYVTVNPGVTVLTNANIENAVGTTATPFVTGLLQVLDSDNLLRQWATDYSEWKANNTANFNTWKTTEQTNFTTWKTTEQTNFTSWETTNKNQFLAWFNELEDYLTPSAEATLTDHVTKIERVLTATFTASGWTQSGSVWTQTQEVVGMAATHKPILVSQLAAGATAVQQKAYNKAFAILCAGYGTTASDSVTLTVYKQPATDILVGFKGI